MGLQRHVRLVEAGGRVADRRAGSSRGACRSAPTWRTPGRGRRCSRRAPCAGSASNRCEACLVAVRAGHRHAGQVALAHVHSAPGDAVGHRRVAARCTTGRRRRTPARPCARRGSVVACPVGLLDVAALEVVAAACLGVAVQAGAARRRLRRSTAACRMETVMFAVSGTKANGAVRRLQRPLVARRVAEQAVDVLQLRLRGVRRRLQAEARVAARAAAVNDLPGARRQLAQPVDVRVDAEVVDASQLACRSPGSGPWTRWRRRSTGSAPTGGMPRPRPYGTARQVFVPS